MAGQAEKKQAVANGKTLKEIHTISLVVTLASIISIFGLSRPDNWKTWLLFNVPAWTSEYTLERIGRPKYHKDPRGYDILDTAGEDLSQPGLTEYIFDVFYLTMIADVLMCVFGTPKVFWLLLLVPIYAGYKLFGLYRTFRPKQSKEAKEVPIEQQKSKRQQKREKREQKGEKIRYSRR